MSSKITAGLMCVIAMLAMSALAASVASARQFKISGKTFTGTESITTTILSAGLAFKGFLPGKKEEVEVNCKGITVPGANIFGNFRFSDEKLVFSSCAITKPAGCRLVTTGGEPTTIIETVAVSGEVEEEGTPVKLFFRFKPATPTEGQELFTSIHIGECAGEGTFKVVGVARCEFLTATEVVLKGCNFTATSGSMFKLGKEPAQLLGLVGLSLAGTGKGLVWNVN
jgi:hypothetical protein